MKNRIKELRQKHNIKQSELAEVVGVAQNTLSYWERGIYDIDNDSLKKMADYFHVSVDFLLFRDEKSFGFDNIFAIETKKVPLLGDIACGQPIFADEQYGEFVAISKDVDCDFCLRAKGDSMTGARILDGDVVFIKKQDTVENGEIAAVVIEDEATLKRVYWYPDQLKLVLNAENPAFAPFVYVGEELDQIHILGKAVAFQSLIR